MNCGVRQPIQDAFTPVTNAGKRYKLTLKPERGKTNTNYVNLFNGSHILIEKNLKIFSNKKIDESRKQQILSQYFISNSCAKTPPLICYFFSLFKG